MDKSESNTTEQPSNGGPPQNFVRSTSGAQTDSHSIIRGGNPFCCSSRKGKGTVLKCTTGLFQLIFEKGANAIQ